jgi:hypothetical protein
MKRPTFALLKRRVTDKRNRGEYTPQRAYQRMLCIMMAERLRNEMKPRRKRG